MSKELPVLCTEYFHTILPKTGLWVVFLGVGKKTVPCAGPIMVHFGCGTPHVGGISPLLDWGGGRSPPPALKSNPGPCLQLVKLVLRSEPALPNSQTEQRFSSGLRPHPAPSLLQWDAFSSATADVQVVADALQPRCSLLVLRLRWCVTGPQRLEEGLFKMQGSIIISTSAAFSQFAVGI